MSTIDPSSMILVLNSKGENLGQMPYRDAKKIAEEEKLDLVLVNKTNKSSVYKIMDYGRWKYSQKKHQKKNQNKSHQSQSLKEVNFKMRIDSHDEEIKIEKIRKFLFKGSDVKITVIMRGREKTHPKMAQEKIDDILSKIQDAGITQNRNSSPHSVIAIVRPSDQRKSDASKNNTQKNISKKIYKEETR